MGGSMARINGTDVCTCSTFSGWDDSCIDANCTYGTVAGCSTRMPVHNLSLALCIVTMLIVTFVLGYALFVVWKGRAMCSRNVTSTTLLWLVLAAISLFLWFGTVLISTINGTWELMVRLCVGVVGGALGSRGFKSARSGGADTPRESATA